MKPIYRISCLLIVLILAASALVACGDDTSTSSNPSDSATESTGSETSQDTSFRLEKKDFGDTVINVLTYNSESSFNYQTCEIAPETITTEPVNDAAYNRAQLIEQEYGIILKTHLVDTKNDVVSTIRQMAQSNLDTYQIVLAPLHYLAQLSGEDVYYDLSDMEYDYIDLSQPYWDQNTVEDLSIKGKTFFVNGDAIVTDDEATWAIFFNKAIAEDNHLAEAYGEDSIYDIVKNDKWTLDVMYAMAKAVTSDSDGNGMEWSTSSRDVWGLNSQLYDAYAFTVSAGHTMTTVDGSGVPIITIGDEGNIRAYEKIHNILSDTANVAIAEINGATSSTKYDDIVTIFANGSALFTPERVNIVSNSVLRNANIRYGILPMPKLDETQDNYTTTVTVWWCSALAIPISNVENLEATCYAMEALAYYGQELLTPEYYERTLKTKRFEDTESEEMLDLIFRNRTYDVGAVMNFGSNMLYFYPDILKNGTNTHVSDLDSKRDAYQEAIDDFVDLFS